MVLIGIIFKIDLENFERKYHLKSNGFNFEKVLGRVAELLDLKPESPLNQFNFCSQAFIKIN